MVVLRVNTFNRIALEDGAAVTVTVVFPDGRDNYCIKTDTAGVAKACDHFDSNMVHLQITQPTPNALRVEILDEETTEGEHDMILKYLRAIFHELTADA